MMLTLARYRTAEAVMSDWLRFALSGMEAPCGHLHCQENLYPGDCYQRR